MNIILLSGGSGKRLWPLSNDIRSKQFIKLFKDSDDVVIEVTDDGAAIDPEFVPRMFEAFSRGDSTRKTDGGTGLGLAISRKIIEKHKGTLKYMRAEDRNCFCIRLH